jgi:L-rhamnose mutarotase
MTTPILQGPGACLAANLACLVAISAGAESTALATSPAASTHYGSVIGIRADQIERYQCLQAEMPAEVRARMTKSHLHNYSIYVRRFPDGKHYLCRHFEYTGQDFAGDLRALETDEAVSQWRQQVGSSLEPLPDRAEGQWWAPMERVFYFGGPPYDRTKVQRMASVIGLKEEHLERYKHLHASTWMGVLNAIAAAQIRNYSIFLGRFPDGKLYLFGYFEYVGDDFVRDGARMGQDETTQRWWKETDPTQIPFADRGAGNWWAPMEEVFHQD